MHKHASLLIAGGLAAPALAAVAGSVATTIGGSAAAATAVTGMMGSSVGAASMIAGFGYYGGRVTADHMARRIGIFTHSTPLCLPHSYMHAFLQASFRSFVQLFIHSSIHSIHQPTNPYAFSLPPFLMHAFMESFVCALGRTVIQSYMFCSRAVGRIQTTSTVSKPFCREESVLPGVADASAISAENPRSHLLHLRTCCLTGLCPL